MNRLAQLIIQQNKLLLLSLTSKKNPFMLLAVQHSSVLLLALVPHHLVARSRSCPFKAGTHKAYASATSAIGYCAA